jgi:hypothetical protein
MIMDGEDDDRAYAALEAEMDEPGPSWADPAGDSGGDDGPGGAPAYQAAAEERPERQESTEAQDFEAVEQASLQADEWEYQLREQHARAAQHRQPDLYDDPLAHVQSMQQELQQMRAEREYKSFTSQVEQAENAFSAMTPDYHAAVETLEKGRRAELTAMYPDNSPQAHLVARQQGFRSPAQLRDAIFIQDAQTVAGNAMRAGINPAKAYYDLAVARGWQPKSGRSGGGRSGGRGSATTVAKLLDTYTEDPAEFDRQWDRMAKTGALG